MKKLLILLCLCILGCSNNNDIKIFKKEYESLNSENIEVNISLNNKIVYLSTKEVVQFLKEGTGVIYFGIASDTQSRSIVETLLEVVKDNDLELKYYNPSNFKDEDLDDFAQIIGILSEYLQKNDDGELMLLTPDVYFVNNGKIVGNHFGSVSDFADKALTDEQKKELYDSYNQLSQSIRH